MAQRMRDILINVAAVIGAFAVVLGAPVLIVLFIASLFPAPFGILVLLLIIGLLSYWLYRDPWVKGGE